MEIYRKNKSNLLYKHENRYGYLGRHKKIPLNDNRYSRALSHRYICKCGAEGHKDFPISHEIVRGMYEKTFYCRSLRMWKMFGHLTWKRKEMKEKERE